jgi:menaquinone-9 beta-reductase
MPGAKPITIVGGGLAGLALGIGLRQQNVPVTLWEAAQYPRHRVCGEFISGAGQDALGRLGLRSLLLDAGATAAQDAAFIFGQVNLPARRLPSPALCLSRYVMDHLLAKEFGRLGGELREQSRWREQFGEGVVRASGRRAQAVGNGWRWFGVKAHARNVTLTADLEMHALANGYVGLCRLGGETFNICGLFRRRTGSARASHGELEWLRGEPGTQLNERLARAEFDKSSLCSVAGLNLRPQRASHHDECCIGDALTMIPPVTGNGMSMAVESAEIAVTPLAAYSRGEISWATARETFARGCDGRFARRLAWAGLLQRMMFSPLLQGGLGSMALRADWLWRMMFAKTRC